MYCTVYVLSKGSVKSKLNHVDRMRYWRSIGLGYAVPKEAKEGAVRTWQVEQRRHRAVKNHHDSFDLTCNYLVSHSKYVVFVQFAQETL